MRLITFISLIFLSSLLQAESTVGSGKDIYEHFCISCHQDGVANAPKINDSKDWGKHLSNRSLDDLVNSATQGLNAMPAQGTCVECNQEDLKAAIQYMLPTS